MWTVICRYWRKYYTTFRPVVKYILWPVLLTAIIWLFIKNDTKLQQIESIKVLLTYINILIDFVVYLVNELWKLALFYIVLFISARYMKKCKELHVVQKVSSLGIVIGCIIFLMLAIIAYLSTLVDGNTSTIIPMYYAAAVITYDWIERIVIELF